MLYLFVIIMTRVFASVSIFQGTVDTCNYSGGKASLLYCVARCIELVPDNDKLSGPKLERKSCSYDMQAFLSPYRLYRNTNSTSVTKPSSNNTAVIDSQQSINVTIKVELSTDIVDTTTFVNTNISSSSIEQPLISVTSTEQSISSITSTEQILVTTQLQERLANITELTSEHPSSLLESISVPTAMSSEQSVPVEHSTNIIEQSTSLNQSSTSENISTTNEQLSSTTEQSSTSLIEQTSTSSEAVSKVDQSSSITQQKSVTEQITEQSTVQTTQTEQKIEPDLFAMLQQSQLISEQPQNTHNVEQSSQQPTSSLEQSPRGEQSTSSILQLVSGQPVSVEQTGQLETTSVGEQPIQQIRPNKLDINKIQLRKRNSEVMCLSNITCTINENFFKDGKLDATMIPGTLVPFCGKLYFMGNNKTTSDEARAACCALNMDVLTIDSVEELFCISRYLRYNLNNTETPSPTFWTSARRDPNIKNNFRWCSRADANVSKDLWALPPMKGACANVALSTELIADSGTRAGACNEMHSVLCQVEDASVPTTAVPTTEDPTCKRPQCPSLLCNDSTDVQQNEISLKNFTDFGPTCDSRAGKRYFLSNFKVTHAGAFFACCKISLKVFTPINETEAECIRTQLFKALKKKTHFAWTSGTSQGCRSRWRFCTNNAPLRGLDYMWAASQPDNRHDHERCLSIGKQVVINGLMDHDCDSLFPVVCEKPL